MALLEIKNARIEYERNDGSSVLAVDDVSLAIEEGEFVSIVGPSGCGKTTLLKTIDSLVPLSSGEIMLLGRPITSNSRDRAMVFQEASLFPWFSVLRNIAYGLECQGVKRRDAEEQVRPLVRLVGLEGFEKHYPYEISGGMQQRANLARALAVDPKILLMDEPFAALDAQTRDMMQAELLDVWSQTRKTVIFITHQINEAVYLSDRVLVMSARPGRVLDDVSIDLSRPRQLAVKRSEEFAQYETRIWSHIESQGRRNMSAERSDDMATAAPGES